MSESRDMTYSRIISLDFRNDSKNSNLVIALNDVTKMYSENQVAVGLAEVCCLP